MSVMQSTGRIAPKSILRHRPIENVSTEPGTKTSSGDEAESGMHAPVARASRVLSDVKEWQGRGERLPERVTRAIRPVSKTTTRRQQPRQLLQSLQGLSQRLGGQPAIARSSSFLYVGVGMLAMVLCWVAVSAAASWYTALHDNMLYGTPRTFQIDAYVGHNERSGQASHFIAQNLHGRILVIEIPGGDVSKSRIYAGPQLYGADAALIPITLQFQDVNRDGRLDMVIQFKDTRLIYMNDGTGFRPASAADGGLQALSSS
jgi:hypothetical protein